MKKTNIRQIIFTILLSVISVFAYTTISKAATCIHTYSAATCTQPKKCTKCDKTSGSALGHNPDSNGICTRCGATYGTSSGGNTGSTGNTGTTHIHTYSAATCTQPKKCSCGATSGSALGHNFEVKESSTATCTAAGSTKTVCKRCGLTQTATTPATGHNYKVTTNTSATCTTAGKKVETCSKCGDTKTSTTQATGHDYKVTTNVPATCTSAGKKVETCLKCNDAKTTNIPAIGHNYKETTNTPATCTTSGKIIKTCENCKDQITSTTPPTGHDYATSSTTATCTTAGISTKKCKKCNDTITTTTAALGHDYKETSKVEPTCTTAGKVVETCTRCNDVRERNLAALGHEENIVFNTTHHWYECDNCNTETSDRELHDYDDDNVCRVCGYKKNGDEGEEEPGPGEEDDDELIIEPWMQENDELNCLAVSLRSEPYEEDRANKNIYALDEKIIYYVDYKNGAKDTDKDVILKLTLPLSFSVVDSDGATVSKSNKTLTWKFKGMENGDCGTKVVVIKYTSLGNSKLTYKKIFPKATISLEDRQKDVSAVINLIVKDLDTEINDTHEPYMYGDKDTKTFRPDDTIRRSEGALVLTRIFGISTRYDENTYAYPDLNETYLEARKAIMAATAHGIIEGYPDGTYKPNKRMTRGEFITILARQIEEEYGEGFEVKDEKSSIKVYKDKTRIYYLSENEYYDAHWSIAYATLLARLNMTPLTEDDTNLRVDDSITRAEVAQQVNYYLLRAPAEITSSVKVQFPDVSRRHKLFADIVEATRGAHEYSITDEGTEVAE